MRALPGSGLTAALQKNTLTGVVLFEVVPATPSLEENGAASVGLDVALALGRAVDATAGRCLLRHDHDAMTTRDDDCLPLLVPLAVDPQSTVEHRDGLLPLGFAEIGLGTRRNHSERLIGAVGVEPQAVNETSLIEVMPDSHLLPPRRSRNRRHSPVFCFLREFAL
ncbi:MAG: hypothetical protein A3C90_02995 [Candidatus Magasanikbacteria bacterium RIFCSPHIGHO2_02_FULL_51_14]|uniref:Uncharacterized protein n=1 Tax=Candidatus Magasanikbacteria bacterium RIFCSPHIGHO2_02_FULL_51_14 TaxID=1798683 RepID=A0A1F6MFC5_9BACT|nr:MAG: hypothetical protein A3C90_02995 [Candidatus Magasanikbacteria bacterium RIFCSPHIGHO2_02_FULL_51_14]